MNFDDVRREYPLFCYHGFRLSPAERGLALEFHFSIPGLAEFRPAWFLPNPANLPPEDPAVRRLAFSLGMVELISYWKITCSPLVEVHAASLEDHQASWWKKLYFNGLGEFFYLNGIETDSDSFMELRGTGTPLPAVAGREGLSGCLIPVGGGKDSVVTLELLRDRVSDNCCYLVNDRGSSRRCAELAGYGEKQILCARRTLDPGMLELNRQGFFNGHTPFSAIVAFSGVLTALLAGKRYVVLSNEDSANEPTLSDSEVNHQYSKSLEFERDFADYLSRYIPCGVEYFSLLRPLSELQIAALFAGYRQYHGVFRSCNRGSKRDVWCADCPKCLFVCLLLSPFLSRPELDEIFGAGLLENRGLLETLEQLTGELPNKPFECVGSREELNTAIYLGISRMQERGETLPYLLERYRNSRQYRLQKEVPNRYADYFNEKHLVPPEFEPVVRKAAQECWKKSAGCSLGKVQDYVDQHLAKKRILIWGAGREGVSTYKFLRRHLPEVPLWVADPNPLPPGLEDCTHLQTGRWTEDFDSFDLIFKSPGIDILDPRVSREKLTSQTQVFLALFRDQVIGITGTKGKSTTSSLLYHILRGCREDVVFVGNIGIPCLDRADEVGPDTLVVFELSCHQLECVNVSPHMGVILNLYEDHLDHYGDFARYVRAKENIFRYRQAGDVTVLNAADTAQVKAVRALLTAERPAEGSLTAPLALASMDTLGDICLSEAGDLLRTPAGDLRLAEGDTALPGLHNRYNIAIAFYLCRLCGVEAEDFRRELSTFRGLPHRLEYVGTVDGVDYYDDSISTICETTIQALGCLPNVGTVLIGGMDRGIDYRDLAICLLDSGVDNIVLMPETSERILALLDALSGGSCSKRIFQVSGLEEAVQTAKKHTVSGKTCLLSPAAASYGFFKNFEERGDIFQRLVRGD